MQGRGDIQKVFHGADYDVRSLYRDFKININNLFDTELACRFLGFKASGLDAVLTKRYNVHLNKKYQRKDWSKRPLPEEMVAAATAARVRPGAGTGGDGRVWRVAFPRTGAAVFSRQSTSPAAGSGTDQVSVRFRSRGMTPTQLNRMAAPAGPRRVG